MIGSKLRIDEFLTVALSGFLIFFSASINPANGAYPEEDATAYSYVLPDRATQNELIKCFNEGYCRDTNYEVQSYYRNIPRRYPMKCDGSGDKDCTGCWAITPSGLTRVGELSNGTCEVKTYANASGTKARPQQIRIFVSYQMKCPVGTIINPLTNQSTGFCQGGEIHLQCRITGLDDGKYENNTLRSLDRLCFPEIYKHKATAISGVGVCTPNEDCATLQPQYCPAQTVYNSCGENCGPGTRTNCAVPQCPAGSYNATGTNTCTLCPSGTYGKNTQDSGSMTERCTTCPYPDNMQNYVKATLLSIPGATNISQCSLSYYCGFGYSPTTTSPAVIDDPIYYTQAVCSSATPCPPGERGPGDGFCTPCSSGTYADSEGSRFCTSCPPPNNYDNFTPGSQLFTTEPATGATNVTQCRMNYTCMSGYSPTQKLPAIAPYFYAGCKSNTAPSTIDPPGTLPDGTICVIGGSATDSITAYSGTTAFPNYYWGCGKCVTPPDPTKTRVGCSKYNSFTTCGAKNFPDTGASCMINSPYNPKLSGTPNGYLCSGTHCAPY